MISQTISHYRIIQKLGAGGMGEVYKAYDTALERPVALKILPAGLVQHEDRVRRFIQEAKAASSLNHPHIITIHEIGQVKPENGETLKFASDPKSSEDETKVGGTPLVTGAGVIHYIAMEFIDGETLTARIHQNRASLRRLLEYLLQVADGLTKAHQSGIVHRDLKPDNIMITGDGYAKILDFGLAKLMEPHRPMSSDSTEAATALMGETQPGVVIGTVGYMSPEQAKGGHMDHRSDIFSFGCILYEAVTRRKPFQGDSVIDSLHKIIYTEPLPVREFNPTCPYELLRIIRRCLAKDPEDRYQRMKDVALDLREMLEEYRTEGLFTGAQGGLRPDMPSAFGLDAEAADLKLDEADPKVKQLARFSKASVALVVLGVLSAIIFWPAYRRAEIGSDLKLDYAKEAALAKAREVATGLGYDVGGMNRTVNFTSRNLNLKHVAATEGVAGSRRAVQEGKVAAWQVIFTASGVTSPPYGWSPKPGELSVSISPQGELVNFSTPPRDGIEVETPDKGQALEMATQFAQRWLSIDPSGYDVEYVPRSSPPGVVEITWRNPNPILGHREIARVNLQGSKVTTLSRTLEPIQPGEYEPWFAETISNIRIIMIGLPSAAIYLFGVIFLIRGKRWHAFGRSLPLVLAIMVAVGLFGFIFFQNPSDHSVSAYVGMAINGLICGVALFPSCAGLLEWLRSRSPLRLFGSEQMATRQFLSPSVAASLVHGVLAGVLLAGLANVMKAMLMWIPGYLPSMSDEIQAISGGWPALSSLSLAGISILFVLAISVIVELSERVIHKQVLVTVAPALILAAATSSDYDQPKPLAVGVAFLSSFLGMLVMVHIYRTRGLAAMWLASTAWFLLEYAARVRFVEVPAFVLQSNLLLLGVVALLALGAWGYLRERLTKNKGALAAR